MKNFENKAPPSWRSDFLNMPASEAENNACLSDEGFDSRIMLSAYAELLEINAKRRYLEKISVIGIDPLVIPQQKYSSECLPPGEACDLLSYLVLKTSFYMKEQFKNFRSL